MRAAPSLTTTTLVLLLSASPLKNDALTFSSTLHRTTHRSISMTMTNDNSTPEPSLITRRRSLLPLLSSPLLLLTTTTQKSNAAQPAQTYLTEPTEEFKESERQRMEFRKAQLDLKKQFLVVFDRITNQSTTEDQIRTDLEDLRALVAKTGGLPLGIKKDELVKVVRAKKAKGFWPTSVEYAYQALIREIAYQQSPNTDKELGNPMDQRAGV